MELEVTQAFPTVIGQLRSFRVGSITWLHPYASQSPRLAVSFNATLGAPKNPNDAP